MPAQVKVNISRGKVITVCGPMIDQAAYRAAQKARGYVISEIRSAGRVRTGRMIALMQARKVSAPGLSSRYEVSSSAHYTMFQNDGVRPFGPRTAKALAFVPKGSSTVVFAKRVRGFPGAHFYEKGLARVRLQDFLP